MKISYLIKLVAGPIAAMVLILFFDLSPGHPMVTKMAAIAVWMAIWWFTEVVDPAVTALIPFLMMPLLGIMDPKTVAAQYMDQVLFLFIGGFIISFAIERWGLHHRLSLKILGLLGNSPNKILASVMLTTFLISNWMSNTATVMVLIPAVHALIKQVENHLATDEEKNKIASSLLLGLAYAATIGGMGTIVGTPVNMVFISFYNNAFPGNKDATFMNWFVLGYPIAVAFLISSYFVIRRLNMPGMGAIRFDKGFFQSEYKSLGPMRYEEKVVGIIFFITAVLWFTRADIAFGSFTLPGWNRIFHIPEYIQDSTVAVGMALLLFFIPARSEKGRSILEWEDCKKMPYGIILLFGSGFALSKGFETTGLSNWLALQLKFLDGVNPILIVLGICVMVSIISEFASNIACIQLTLPILMALQKDLHVHPLVLMLPAAFAASIGFMLPVATGANTIVFGSHRITVKEMVKTGFVLDILGILIITIGMMTIGMWWFGL